MSENLNTSKNTSQHNLLKILLAAGMPHLKNQINIASIVQGIGCVHQNRDKAMRTALFGWHPR